MTVVLDQPAQIANWRLMSAVSQLALEVSTGENFYGSKGSVYHPIRRDYIDGLPARATMRNKCLALATFLNNLPDGPVVRNARKSLEERLAKEGWQISQ
jgi:hypothetical protein